MLYFALGAVKKMLVISKAISKCSILIFSSNYDDKTPKYLQISVSFMLVHAKKKVVSSDSVIRDKENEDNDENKDNEENEGN